MVQSVKTVSYISACRTTHHVHYTNGEMNAYGTGAHQILFNDTDLYAWRLAHLFRGFACIHNLAPMGDENRHLQKPSIHLKHKSYKIVSYDERFRRISELIYYTTNSLWVIWSVRGHETANFPITFRIAILLNLYL
jgi:hypothetical protein